MITRRGFLQTTLVTAGMQAGAPVHGSMRSLLAPPIHIIAIAGCDAGEAFCGTLGQRAQTFSVDVGDVLQELAAGRGAEPGSVCLGLTRDSDHLLIRQVFIERNSDQIYFGRHERSAGGWRHQLLAPVAVADPLAAALRDPADWAQVLAEHASSIAGASGRGVQREAITSQRVKSAGPTCLVSWAYRVGGVQA